LDPITTQMIMKDLKKINQELKCTVILNLHSVELARDFSSRIIGLRAGEIVFDGTPEEATDEVLTEIYGADILKSKEEEAI
ncbi:phosphonate ABC transporter ATP-binding protein, partial [Melissococcus plutonius]